jgi:hypothetical protein
VLNRILVALSLSLVLTGCPDDGGEYDPGYDDDPSDNDDNDNDDDNDDAAVAHFFLPTGEPDNTSAPTVETDARGGVHSVYPAYAGGDAYYAYCAPGCDETTDVKVVRFPTEGTVHNAMIALDAAGKPSVLLATGQRVHYATCTGDCTRAESWALTEILDHQGEREVTGEAFALDPDGRPRFMMHVYKAYLGWGQKPPQAFYVKCDAADCHRPEAWTQHKVADQMWRASTLRFDADGKAHLLTVINKDASEYSSGTETAAYVECAGGCEDSASWNGTYLMPIFESEFEAIRVTPSLSMALTRAGAPRVILLGYLDSKRNLTYFSCDADCTGAGWAGSIISDHEDLGVGLDMVLDKSDRPRFVHTLDYNIALAYCDESDCADPEAKWGLEKVEYSGEMDPDTIFLWPNCIDGAWFLHSPSIALGPSGKTIVGYQARDISGGWENPDPHETPDCVAGTDMTWSRVTIL